MMEVNRTGKLITISNVDGDVQSGLRMNLRDFVRIEKLEGTVYVNVWDMKRQGFTFDIYVENEAVIHRMEDFLNAHGYVLRLTPAKAIVS